MGKNYDEIMELIGKTAEITKDTSENTAIMLKKLQEQERLLGGLSQTVNGINDTVIGLSNDIDQLKLNEEVTTTQQETICDTARKRICEILGDDGYERQKYFKLFVQRLYGDTRRFAGLGSKIARTRKGDFQRVIDYMEAWTPAIGCAELKRYGDELAAARKKAREEGYV